MLVNLKSKYYLDPFDTYLKSPINFKSGCKGARHFNKGKLNPETKSSRMNPVSVHLANILKFFLPIPVNLLSSGAGKRKGNLGGNSLFMARSVQIHKDNEFLTPILTSPCVVCLLLNYFKGCKQKVLGNLKCHDNTTHMVCFSKYPMKNI